MKNNKHWNTVDWSQIPEDVEAVVTFVSDDSTYYRMEDGELLCQCYRERDFSQSGWRDYEGLVEEFSDRLHLRPTPAIQPTPEPPESTQVESSEVEATTIPEFDWSSVDEDVEAVIIEDGKLLYQLKSVNGRLYHRVLRCGRKRWVMGHYSTLASIEKYLHLLGCGGCQLICRPPATLAPEVDTFSLADIKQLNDSGCFDAINENPIRDVVTPEVDMYDMFKEDIRGSNLMCNTSPSKPSISTILQEAQQSILKHHGVTGKVNFTVTCSE